MPAVREAPAPVVRTVQRGGVVRHRSAAFQHPDLAELHGMRVEIHRVSDRDVDVFRRGGPVICRASILNAGAQANAGDDDDQSAASGQPAPVQTPPSGNGGAVALPQPPPSEDRKADFARPPARVEHFQGLQGASIILTDNLLLAQLAIEDAVDAMAIAVLFGEAGLGKTTALEWVLRGLKHTTVTFSNRPTPRETVAELYEALTGHVARGTRYAITRALRDVLRRPRIIAVDEAQHLSVDCLQVLRKLHDRADARFCLVFVGGPNCADALDSDPMLSSRIFASVEFQPLTDAAIRAAMPGYHPIYRDADPSLLLRINDEYAHGSFRTWALFTHWAAKLCARREQTLDDSIIDAVKALDQLRTAR